MQVQLIQKAAGYQFPAGRRGAWTFSRRGTRSRRRFQPRRRAAAWRRRFYAPTQCSYIVLTTELL